MAQKTEYNQDFANYYSERTAFANVIAQKVADDSVGNLQIGMVNLLKGSNVELNRQQYSLGTYFYDTIPEVGKTYTIVMCYTLEENNTHINVFQDYGSNYAANFNTRGNRVIESKSFKFTIENTIYMGFVQFPNGTYGSKVHWAVLVEGNKGPNAWIPSLSEQGETAAKDAVDNLQIGSVNLVSRKMMLAWNEKNKDIAVWGQDSDGIYLSINPALLYNNTGNGTEDIFLGENKYKANTQYVFSIDWKTSTTESTDKVGLTVYVAYTDGSSASLLRASNQQTTKKRTDYITEKGKTIRKIFNSYGYWINCRIYSLALYEGNKVLSEPPVATEDLTGQSNVNLLDNSKFQFGTEGYFPNQQATLNVVDGVLQVRSSKTSSTPGVQFPVVHLHPGVYTIKMRAKGINISSCHCYVYKDGTSDRVGVDGISISPVFSGISFTFAVSIEHDYKIYWMWSASTAASYPAGIDIEYSMLTAGEIAPQDWNPSPGDVAKDIKDVSDAVSNLDTTINTTFKDGIISEAEAKAIASNINVLNAEKADIDAYYNKLYANAYLTGTAKTNLASAKTAYNTAHTNLINSINTAIADGKATATEKADVDDKFTAYNNALSAYQTRVGEADKAIQDTIKKVADDAQTSANTAQSAANAAQSAANQAQADANAANSKLATWASDNYISPQEKTALKQQESDIQAEYNDIVANANRYNISLTSYSTAYNSAISALNKYTATSPENIAVSSDYNNIAAYYPARQTILNSIATAAKAQADKATWAIGMDGGKMLYDDPEFKKGLNGVSTYWAQNNGDNGRGTVVLSRISKSTGNTSSNSFTAAEAAHVKEEAAGAPHNGSDWCLYIKAYGGTTTSHLGGFGFGNQSRANAVFIVKVSAKIPVGYTLKNAHNAHGDNYKQEFLTSMAGTGKYETYIFKETCGTTGTFNSINWLYLSGPVKPESDPLEWFVDYATVFDLTADGYGDIEFSAKDDLAQQLGYSNFDKMVENASKGETIIKGAYINTKLIDVETLVADTALVDKLIGRELNFTLGSVGGFKMESTLLYSGAKFGTGGAGIAMQSMTNNYGFNVYKDNNNYMEMFQRSSEWGLKGVVGGNTILQLGSTNKIGGFDITDDRIGSIFGTGGVGNGMSLYDFVVKFKSDNSGDSRFAALGTSVYPSSTAQSTLLRLEETRSGNLDNILSYFYCSGASGVLDSRNIAIKVGKGDVDIDNGNLNMAAGNFMKMKGQIHFDNVVTYTGSGAVTITADSGHFIYLTPITGNPVVVVSSGLPIGSWFIIAHATTAGGFYYIKLSGSDRFRRRNNAYQQVNSHNQDPSLIFKVNNTTWIIGNLPVNWIDWN